MNSDQSVKLLSASLFELLCSYGYKKSGTRYIRQLPEVVHMISIQRSRSSTANVVKVTVNFGVLVVKLAQALEDPVIPKAIEYCHWIRRIGHLSQLGIDKWWYIEDETSLNSATMEIVSLVKDFGLPALDELSTAESLVQIWRAGIGFGITPRLRERLLEAADGLAKQGL